MFELAFPWATLRRSKRGRGLAALALLLTAAAFIAACLSELISPAPPRFAAAAATLTAFGLGLRQWRRPGPAEQLRLTADARILARTDPASEPRPLSVHFVAPWLIVLGDSASVLPVWPDCLGADEFRRLAVACRWRRVEYTP